MCYPACFLLVAVAVLMFGCASRMDPLAEVLDARLDAHRALLTHSEWHRVQILLSEVIDDGGVPRLRRYSFREDEEYFYPASAIKLGAAVAALEYVHDLNEGRGAEARIGVDSPLVFDPLFPGETRESDDVTNLQGGKITLRHDIRKIGLVSDNAAFNHLYEFLGQKRLNESLRRAGLSSACIVHRLSESRTREENWRYPRISMESASGSPVILRERTNWIDHDNSRIPGFLVGRAHYSHGKLVEQAFSFRHKNRMSLRDLQDMLVKVVRPDIVLGTPGFRLDEADRVLLRSALSDWVSASKNPVYDATAHPDSSCKFLLPGLLRVVSKRNLRITSKVGRAYGFSVENAYVENLRTGQVFFLAAALYTNANEILNDDHYEYETVADPFLADLGEAVARRLWTSSQ